MARTKKQEAAKLAQLAHCMDNWVRTENKMLYEKIEELKQQHHDEIIQNANYALDMIQLRERRIRELEAQWEDMANTLHDAVEENFRMIKRIEILEAQLLDCTCNEESI
jgi:regulator of replication initiation timing